MIIIPANTLSTGGFDVDNSLRFNSGDDCKLSRTAPNSSPTNADKFTISFWIKRSNIDAGSGHERQQVYTTYDGSGSPYQEFQIYFTQNTLRIQTYNSSNKMELVTSRVFRDVSAWYSIIFSYDSSPSTPSSSSIRLWINGVQETSFSTETYPSQNVNGEFAIQNHIQMIGNNSANARDLGCYLAEFVGVDGQALINTDFGEFDSDSGIWKPIDVSGINVGTLGFYLDFENSSALGTDVSSVGNFTLANLSSTDQSTDTCTNNFCTINSLDNFYEAGTLAEGNLKYTANTGRSTYITSTFGVSTGRWYYEVLCSTEGSNSYKTVGFTPTSSTTNTNWFGEDADHVSYYHSGKIYNGGTASGTYGSSWAANDILGCYLDLTSNKAYFSKNGVLQNSGTGYDISGAAFQTNDFWFFTVGMPAAQSPGTVLETNFGSPPFAISSGNTDDNGYGNFEYSPNITGDGAAKSFYALCTKNLAEFG